MTLPTQSNDLARRTALSIASWGARWGLPGAAALTLLWGLTACGVGWLGATDQSGGSSQPVFRVLSTVPSGDLSQGPVSATRSILVVFSHEVDPETLNDSTVQVRTSGGSSLTPTAVLFSELLAPAGIQINGPAATFRLAAPTHVLTNYTITLSSEVRNLSGTRLNGGHELTFEVQDGCFGPVEVVGFLNPLAGLGLLPDRSRVTVLFGLQDATQPSVVAASHAAPDQGWQAPIILHTTDEQLSASDLVLSTGGQIALGWQQGDPNYNQTSLPLVTLQASVRGSGPWPQTPTVIDGLAPGSVGVEPPLGARHISWSPLLEFASNETLVTSFWGWTEPDASGTEFESREVYGNCRPEDGDWGTARRLSTEGVLSTWPHMAAFGDGRALAIWGTADSKSAVFAHPQLDYGFALYDPATGWGTGQSAGLAGAEALFRLTDVYVRDDGIGLALARADDGPRAFLFDVESGNFGAGIPLSPSGQYFLNDFDPGGPGTEDDDYGDELSLPPPANTTQNSRIRGYFQQQPPKALGLPDGRVLVVWDGREAAPLDGRSVPKRIWASLFDLDAGTWDPTTVGLTPDAEQVGSGSVLYEGIEIRVDSLGNVFVVWERNVVQDCPDGSGGFVPWPIETRVEVVRYLAAEGLTDFAQGWSLPATQLNGPGALGEFPNVSQFHPSGELLIGWTDVIRTCPPPALQYISSVSRTFTAESENCP